MRKAMSLIMIGLFGLSILTMSANGINASLLPNATSTAYNIAILEVGQWDEWTADDFYQFDVSPGVESYTWTTIPDSNLTASGLALYDVLIVPWHHDYVWLDSSKAMSIVNWVNTGNRLVAHNYVYELALTDDPLMAAFGTNYRVDWTGEDGGFLGDSVMIIDPTNPLVSTPNALSAVDLSDWERTVHNSIDPSTAGSAWNWAISSVDSGYHWLGYALSGSGVITICGGDPEYHSTRSVDPKSTEARKLIENEIVSTLSTVWNYVFEDSYGRGTVLKINAGDKVFQFITPNKDYGVRKATFMKASSRAVVIDHKDGELKLATLGMDIQLDSCFTVAWDVQTQQRYVLLDKLGPG